MRAHICTQANLLVRAHAHASARPLVTILTIIVTDERMPIASQRLVVFIMVPPDDAMRKDSDRVRNRFLLNATIQAAKSFHYDVKLVTNNGIDDPLYGHRKYELGSFAAAHEFMEKHAPDKHFAVMQHSVTLTGETRVPEKWNFHCRKTQFSSPLLQIYPMALADPPDCQTHLIFSGRFFFHYT